MRLIWLNGRFLSLIGVKYHANFKLIFIGYLFNLRVKL